MPDWTLCAVVERSANKVSGGLVFRGTRLSGKALFEKLKERGFHETVPDAARAPIIE